MRCLYIRGWEGAFKGCDSVAKCFIFRLRQVLSLVLGNRSCCKLPLHSVLGWHGGCGLRACVGFTVYCSGFGFRAYEFHSRFMCYNAFPRITCLEDQWGFSKSIMVITGIAIWIIRVSTYLLSPPEPQPQTLAHKRCK